MKTIRLFILIYFISVLSSFGQYGGHFVSLKNDSILKYVNIIMATNQSIKISDNFTKSGIREISNDQVKDFGTMEYFNAIEKFNLLSKANKTGAEYLKSSATKQGAALLLPVIALVIYFTPIGLAALPATIVSVVIGGVGLGLTIGSLIDLFHAGVMMEDFDKIKLRGINIQK